MKRSSTLMLLALFGASVPAMAADTGWSSGTSPIYSSTPATGWSGFYAGVNIGHAWGTVSNSPAIGGTGNANSTGWGIGGQAGYNFDMGGFVIGAEADLQWSNIGYGQSVGGNTYEARTNLFGTARARAGMPFGQVMPYVTLGGAFGRGTAQTVTPANVTTSVPANHFGWTAGVGLEAMATSNISIKAEYLYVDLGSQAYNGLGVGNVDVGQRFSLVRAGVNYKF